MYFTQDQQKQNMYHSSQTAEEKSIIDGKYEKKRYRPSILPAKMPTVVKLGRAIVWYIQYSVRK